MYVRRVTYSSGRIRIRSVVWAPEKGRGCEIGYCVGEGTQYCFVPASYIAKWWRSMIDSTKERGKH